MYLFVLMFLPVLVGLMYVFYRFGRRAAAHFGADVGRKKVRICLWLGSVAVTALLGIMPGVQMVLLMHIVLSLGLCEFVALVLRKCVKREFPRWRTLHVLGLIPVVLTAAIMLWGYVNMNTVTQTRYSVTTEKQLRPGGYRVALIADVHYGVSVDGQELEDICREVERQEPDLVILCGDIVDDKTTEQGLREVFSALGSIKSELGTYYVYGNHDRPMSLLRSGYTREDLDRVMEENQITILCDDVLPLTRDLVLVGREDRGFGGEGERATVESLVSQADPGQYILTLDHQPREYAQNAAAGTDLLLSGHTHGGQIWPVNLLDDLLNFNDQNYGIKAIDRDSYAIVTSGLAGWGWSIKTAAPSEYVIIDIQNP